MQFSDTTNKNGIIQQIEMKSGIGDGNISGNPTLLKQFTADINNALSRVASIIIRSDNNMRWDDPNHSDTPVSTFNLVSGQGNYNIFEALPNALQDWLEIERVEILDSSGNGYLLEQENLADIKEAINEYDIQGIPNKYRFYGTELFLNPIPNYNKTAGGIIYFNRCPSYFTSTDTTKKAGIPTLSQLLLVFYPVYWWGVTKNQPYTKGIGEQIAIMERELEDFYGRRNKTDKRRLIGGKQDNR